MARKKENNGNPVVNGKSEKSLRELSSINIEIRNIEKRLNNVNEILVKVINELTKIDYPNVETGLIGNDKQKCMAETLPKRIEFKLNHLKFYIDFTLTQENNSSANMIGCMIYGANRSICFTKCIFPHTNDEDKCENCERILRCDRLEDKPLIQFYIDRHGMIQSAGEFEDVWWIDKEDDLPEIHFRTMELIWPKALAWMNENLLA